MRKMSLKSEFPINEAVRSSPYSP